MAEFKQSICIFCSKAVNDIDHEIFDERKKEMLLWLVQNLKINVLESGIMCSDCSDSVKKSQDIKTTYLNITSAIFNVDCKTEIKPIPLENALNTTNVKLENESLTCQFCLNPIENNRSLTLAEISEDHCLQDIYEKYLLNTSTIKPVKVCTNCFNDVQRCAKFIKHLLNMEADIATAPISSEECKTETSCIPEIKVEHHVLCIKPEEEQNVSEDAYFKTETMDDHPPKKDDSLQQSSLAEIELDLEDKPEHINIGSLQNSNCQSLEDKKDITVVDTEKKQLILDHKIQDTRTVYKCQKCEYGTEQDFNLQNHMCGKILQYKCRFCFLKFANKKDLRQHLKTHKKVKTYTCFECNYAAKSKSALEIHILCHKRPEELNMFKCNICSFESKYKRCLVLHSLTHKNPEDLVMYKCEHCDYATRYRKGIKSHLLVHSGKSAVMHQCDICPFETKHKGSLKKHYLTHKNPEELTLYKCSKCSYASKYKTALETHLIAHKDLSEITIYKCEICAFESKYKYTYIRHLDTHNPNRKVSVCKTFSCELCEYTAKNQSRLNLHMLTHKSREEVTMYKCGLCPFQTKHKRSLVIHTMGHKGIKAREARAKMTWCQGQLQAS